MTSFCEPGPAVLEHPSEQARYNGPMLGQRRRLWLSIKTTSDQYLVICGKPIVWTNAQPNSSNTHMLQVKDCGQQYEK